MIGDLDLAFEEGQEPPHWRHRRRRGGRRPGAPKKRRRGRSLIAMFFTLLLLAGLGGAVWWSVGRVGDYFAVKDYSGVGVGAVTVQVVDGDTATDIANKLFKAGVVKSARAFVDAAKKDQASTGIQAGFYKLHLRMAGAEALKMLLAKDQNGNLLNKVSTHVTIPEGMISVDIYPTLAKATGLPVTDFQAAGKDPIALGVPDFWFNRQDKKPAANAVQGAVAIEGFLYPDTYDFDPGSTAKQILSTMVKRFLAEAQKLDFVNQVQQNLNISPYEALITASISQVEGKYPQDMAGISRVIYNRAYAGNFPCNCLQQDSAVNYWLRINGKSQKDSKNLTQSDLNDAKNPYNTHVRPGMPPGPISNPGEDALKGAMNPPKNGNLYFVTIDKEGHTAFADTLAKHDANVALAKKNGVL
jgi:UPF0755 protein